MRKKIEIGGLRPIYRTQSRAKGQEWRDVSDFVPFVDLG